MSQLPVTLFADFTCPFSYVTEAALRGPILERVNVDYRAFELFPPPAPTEGVDRTVDQWETIERLANFHGLRLDPPEARPATRKAHELSRFAREHDLEVEVRDSIYRAFWSSEADIGRIDVLVDLAAQAGLDADDARIALDIDKFTDQIEKDEDVAQRLRIPGSPTMFLGTGKEARVLAGAHGPAVLQTLIEDVSAEWNRE